VIGANDIWKFTVLGFRLFFSIDILNPCSHRFKTECNCRNTST